MVGRIYDPEVAEKLYSGDFPLVDVTVIPDDEIMSHRSRGPLGKRNLWSLPFLQHRF